MGWKDSTLAESRPGRIGRYEIIEQIGSGAMGRVYKARDPSLDRTVAVKIIHPELVLTSASFLERFRSEAKAVGRLSHPGIVTVYDAGAEGAEPYIVMEYLDGHTLSDLIGQELPLDEVIDFSLQMCAALEYAHSQGVIHRDIKPDNVIVLPDRHLKITDFGLARLVHSPRQTQSGLVSGTPSYMSPEQLQGQQPDGRADIFALGCVMYEMLAGRHPFARDSISETLYRILSEDPTPSQKLDRAPRPLTGIVLRALAKDPDRRYQTCAELDQDLRQIGQGAGLPTSPPENKVSKDRIGAGTQKRGQDMAPSKRFGRLLREGITSVAMRQGKNKGFIEQEIANELGYGPDNVQRWQRGYVPKEAEHVIFLVRYCYANGRVDREWASSILQQADYPDLHGLLRELDGGVDSASAPQSEIPAAAASHDVLSWPSLVERGQRQSERYLEVVKGGDSGKYIPALYSSRAAIEHEMACFLESSRTGMVIIGEAGHGKTNLLCRMAEHWTQQGHAVFLYNCGGLARLEVDQELAQDLALPPASSFIQRAEAIGSRALRAGKRFIVLFDAINEFRHERASRAGDLLKNINSLVGRSSYPGIKVILTCRTPTWERLDILGDANLDWGKYYTPDGEDTPFSIGEFTDDEFRYAYGLYSSRFEIQSALDSLSETTKERCRDPLILRLTASAYRGHEIPMNAPSLSVFQEYYDRVERRDDRRFLELLAAEMWQRRTTSLTYDDLVDHPKMSADVAQEPDCAYERLKDLGVLMETEEDYALAVQFTYERIFEYALCRHILRTQKTITCSYVAQLIERASEFPSAWGAAQFAVSLAKNTKKLVIELSDSVDYMARQFVLETLLLQYQDKPKEVLGWLGEMVRAESELTRQAALNVAYQIGHEAKSVFVEGASGAAESTRETVANYVLLLWKQDPDMGLDILQSLIDHLGITTLRSAPHTLRSIIKIAFLFHTNCWDKRLVWRISEVETNAYRKLGITSPALLASPAGKIIEGAAKEGLGRIVLSIFRSVTGSTTAQDERASFEAALELPQEGRDRLHSIIPFLDPSRKDVETISGDLEYLLQMRLGLAAVLSLAVLGVQLESNYDRTRRLLLDLFERSDDAGRFILTVPLVNLTFPTTAAYHELALRLHQRMYEESPGGFLGDPWGTGTYLDVTIATGIVCCLHTSQLDTHLWLIERAAESRDERLLKKCISSLAVLGFFFPRQALQIIFESDIDPSLPAIEQELIQSLAAMRTIHAEQVDRALVRARTPSDFVRRVLATQEPMLVRVCVDAISLLTWVVHYATHSAQAREFITFFALQIAQARSPEDVRKPVTDLWWQRIVDGNYGLVRAVVDKDYFAEFESTEKIR